MMKEDQKTDSMTDVVISRCSGDLVIRPWMSSEIKAVGDYTTNEIDGRTVYEAKGDLVLSVPEDTAVHVEDVRGDAVIRSLRGDLAIDSVAGDLVLANLYTVSVGQVHGDVAASNLSGQLAVNRVDGDMVANSIEGQLSIGTVNGDVAANHLSDGLTLDNIAGDASIRSVAGDVVVSKVGRDVSIRNVAGRCQISKVGGDIRLAGGLGPYEHALMAEGDIVVIWPVDEALLLEANAPKIENRLPLVDVVETQDSLSGRLGEGKTRLTLSAGGIIVLKESEMFSKKWNVNTGHPFEFDFVSELSNLGAKISSEVNEQVARVTADLETNFGPDFMKRMSEQFAEQAARAAKKAEAAADRARQASEQSGRNKASRSESSARAKATSSGGTSEAQLKILKMVEQGTITPDEATILLDALDGD